MCAYKTDVYKIFIICSCIFSASTCFEVYLESRETFAYIQCENFKDTVKVSA